MKYYINLIKKKKFVELIVLFICILFGIYMVCANYIDFTNNGIQFTTLSHSFTGNSIFIALLAETNWGLTMIGLAFIYIFLVFVPCNMPDAQDDSDYTVESRNDKVYVKFRNNEFLLDKETLSPTNFFFRDKNNKFVSITRGYQIYNYITTRYHSLTENLVDTSQVIESPKDIFSKFNTIKIMSKDDKIKYMNYKKISTLYEPISLIVSLLSFACFTFVSLALIVECLEPSLNMKDIISFIVALLICFIAGFALFKYSAKSKNLYKKIMNNKMYVVSCYSYDKKMIPSDDGTSYYIKVANNDYYLNHWFAIPQKIYEENTIITGKLVFFENFTLDEIDLVV